MELENIDALGSNALDEYEPVYTGMQVISGLHCIIKILSNVFRSTCVIQVATSTSDHFILPVQIRHEQKLRVPEDIFPRLYFTMSDLDLKLNFDERNGKEFRTLILTVKGLGTN
jgi:hypothetical protein